jgi:hypothetical protein
VRGGTDGPPFARLSGGYYHRVTERNGTGSRVQSYDVERISPRDLLAAVASNVSESIVGDLARPNTVYEVAATGDRLTTFERFGDDRLGWVYCQGDRYYTVVKTGETRVDRPVMSDGLRPPFLFVGAFAWLAAVLLALPDDLGIGGPL